MNMLKQKRQSLFLISMRHPLKYDANICVPYAGLLSSYTSALRMPGAVYMFDTA